MRLETKVIKDLRGKDRIGCYGRKCPIVNKYYDGKDRKLKLKQWVLCDNCNDWWCFPCMGLNNDKATIKIVNSKDWRCPNCKKRGSTSPQDRQWTKCPICNEIGLLAEKNKDVSKESWICEKCICSSEVKQAKRKKTMRKRSSSTGSRSQRKLFKSDSVEQETSEFLNKSDDDVSFRSISLSPNNVFHQQSFKQKNVEQRWKVEKIETADSDENEENDKRDESDESEETQETQEKEGESDGQDEQTNEDEADEEETDEEEREEKPDEDNVSNKDTDSGNNDEEVDKETCDESEEFQTDDEMDTGEEYEEYDKQASKKKINDNKRERILENKRDIEAENEERKWEEKEQIEKEFDDFIAAYAESTSSTHDSDSDTTDVSKDKPVLKSATDALSSATIKILRGDTTDINISETDAKEMHAILENPSAPQNFILYLNRLQYPTAIKDILCNNHLYHKAAHVRRHVDFCSGKAVTIKHDTLFLFQFVRATLTEKMLTKLMETINKLYLIRYSPVRCNVFEADSSYSSMNEFCFTVASPPNAVLLRRHLEETQSACDYINNVLLPEIIMDALINVLNQPYDAVCALVLSEIDEVPPSTTISKSDSINTSSRVKSLKERKKTSFDEKNKIISGIEDNLLKAKAGDKGFGVFALKNFEIGEYLVEYKGELLTKKQGIEREMLYGPEQHSYLYFFEFKGKSYCVDATPPSENLGRLINHSMSKKNCYTRVVEIDNIPRLCFFAKTSIKTGADLLYDYGERRSFVTKILPWLKD